MSERLLIIGPGRAGLALGSALLDAGELETLTFDGRALEPPPHPVFEAPGVVYRLGPLPPPPATTIILLAVPDAALAEVAHGLAAAGPAPPGGVALHLSGALSTEVLAPLHARGYSTGSLHPLQALADPWTGGERLLGAGFAISGEPVASSAARRLALALGGRPLVIPPKHRPIYHAAATLASNAVVALLAVAVRLFGEAGVSEEDAVPSLVKLMHGTLDNLEQLGPAAALTGPVARGDVDTVRLHLARLSAEDRALYCALGRETLRLARVMGLDGERAAQLETLLGSA